LNFKYILKLSAAGTDFVNLHHRHKHEQSESSGKRRRQACLCYFLCNRMYVHGTELKVGLYYLIQLPIATEFGVRY